MHLRAHVHVRGGIRTLADLSTKRSNDCASLKIKPVVFEAILELSLRIHLVISFFPLAPRPLQLIEQAPEQASGGNGLSRQAGPPSTANLRRQNSRFEAKAVRHCPPLTVELCTCVAATSNTHHHEFIGF